MLVPCMPLCRFAALGCKRRVQIDSNHAEYATEKVHAHSLMETWNWSEFDKAPPPLTHFGPPTTGRYHRVGPCRTPPTGNISVKQAVTQFRLPQSFGVFVLNSVLATLLSADKL
jgi:hypothetical protein